MIESAEPRALFKVRTDDGKPVLAALGTEARRVTVKVLPGDRVTVELSPFDPNRGRIVKKL